MSGIPKRYKAKEREGSGESRRTGGARAASRDTSSTPPPTEEPNEQDMMAVENAAIQDGGSSAADTIRDTLGLKSIPQASSSSAQREIAFCAQLG